MTTPQIPTEIVKLAAKALRQAFIMPMWSPSWEMAHAAIEAAAPALRAQFAEELLATLNQNWTGGQGHTENNKMISIAAVRINAAKIVRDLGDAR